MEKIAFTSFFSWKFALSWIAQHFSTFFFRKSNRENKTELIFFFLSPPSKNVTTYFSSSSCFLNKENGANTKRATVSKELDGSAVRKIENWLKRGEKMFVQWRVNELSEKKLSSCNLIFSICSLNNWKDSVCLDAPVDFQEETQRSKGKLFKLQKCSPT